MMKGRFIECVSTRINFAEDFVHAHMFTPLPGTYTHALVAN